MACRSIFHSRFWIGWKRESKLGNPALEQEVERTGDPDLKQTLDWSKAVNEAIGRMVRGVPPFPCVRESLERLARQADILVVSATPHEALQREWQEHDLAKYTAAIYGQELGSKKQSLAAAAKYPPGHALMIGDAPGDQQAAAANGVLFFPINPGRRRPLAAVSRGGDRPFPCRPLCRGVSSGVVGRLRPLPARPAALAGRGLNRLPEACLYCKVGTSEQCCSRRFGWVAEWSKATVLKTVVGESPPGVRIPPHPFRPFPMPGKSRFFRGFLGFCTGRYRPLRQLTAPDSAARCTSAARSAWPGC